MNSMKKATLLFAVFMVFIVGVVYAVTWYSDIVSVEVIGAYTVTLNAPTSVHVDTEIQFTGSVTDPDGLPVVGGTVEIWRCLGPDDRSHISLAQTATISDGAFSASWTPTVVGDYYFVAEYTSP